eukprot:scaffold176284_cov12-Tisochrysis_lutea.AAC.1
MQQSLHGQGVLLLKPTFVCLDNTLKDRKPEGPLASICIDCAVTHAHEATVTSKDRDSTIKSTQPAQLCPGNGLPPSSSEICSRMNPSCPADRWLAHGVRVG